MSRRVVVQLAGLACDLGIYGADQASLWTNISQVMSSR